MERLKRKKQLPKMTGKQKMKHRNVTLRFTSITGMISNMSKLRRTAELKKRKWQNQKITMRKKLKRMKKSLWLNHSQKNMKKKAEVVGKADNEEQATKEQTINKNMILNKDANIESTKSEGEAKIEDEQYGKPNQISNVKNMKK